MLADLGNAIGDFGEAGEGSQGRGVTSSAGVAHGLIVFRQCQRRAVVVGQGRAAQGTTSFGGTAGAVQNQFSHEDRSLYGIESPSPLHIIDRLEPKITRRTQKIEK